jgi:hypothetical protein
LTRHLPRFTGVSTTELICRPAAKPSALRNRRLCLVAPNDVRAKLYHRRGLSNQLLVRPHRTPRQTRQVIFSSRQFLIFLILVTASMRGVTHLHFCDVSWFNVPPADGRIVPCRSALQKASAGVKPYPHWDSPACLSRWQAARARQPPKHRLIHRRPHRPRIRKSFSVRRKSSTPACPRFSPSTRKTAEHPHSPNT